MAKEISDYLEQLNSSYEWLSDIVKLSFIGTVISYVISLYNH